MELSFGRPRRWTPFGLASLFLLVVARAASSSVGSDDAPLDVVAVGTVQGGRAIMLATPGLPHRGRLWRFRSLDTSDLSQPIENLVLAASGTKLFLQPRDSPGAVLDLTWQPWQNDRLQYVDPRDLAADGIGRRQSHRLPGQRFVSIRGGTAYVIDDSGAVQPEYPVMTATSAAITHDGVVLYIRADRSVVVCGETNDSRSSCRTVLEKAVTDPIGISARSVHQGEARAASPRFLLLSGVEDRTRILDPEASESSHPVMPRAEASLRACLTLHQISISDQRIASLVSALISESAQTQASPGKPVTDWRFFRVAPDEELYVPVLEFARRESVFPSSFEMLAEVRRGARGETVIVDGLYQRYLRIDTDVRRSRCTIHFRTHSTAGSWSIEYWLYYPFDIGGRSSHLHDSEHFFVEVDKLGGRVRRVIGAGHGYVAGNNMYSADKPGAFPADLPLFAIVELGKHATAPDVDRDGVFTPGLDENEYRERAKIWGVRDVIGTINNELLAYDNAMSVPRRADEYLAPASITTRFPHALELASHASCRLERIPAGAPDLPACDDASTDCARRYITSHPDFRNPATILKEWVFPRSFLRAHYIFGPRRGAHSIGAGYAMDLDGMTGLRFVPLPGRVGGEVFLWHQDVNEEDRDSCIANCARADGVGWGIRYEQFISNLFGIFSGVRVYTPPIHDAWIPSVR